MRDEATRRENTRVARRDARENARVARRDARENTRVANETLKREKTATFFPSHHPRLAHRRASRGTTRTDAPRTVASAEGHLSGLH